MKNLKHVGKIKNTGSKVLVVFRTLPGESNMALVVQTSPLSDQYHNAIIDLVDQDVAQDAWEFGEILFTRPFPDGRPMLQALQADNRMIKVATDSIIMTPTPNSEISLHELNSFIAEQKNCAIDDLYTFTKGAPVKKESATPVQDTASVAASTNEVLTDRDIARNFRSQADAMYKEAARLRKQADDLDPPAKKATKSKETESA
jgi:hypothetical protein